MPSAIKIALSINDRDKKTSLYRSLVLVSGESDSLIYGKQGSDVKGFTRVISRGFTTTGFFSKGT